MNNQLVVDKLLASNIQEHIRNKSKILSGMFHKFQILTGTCHN